MPPCLWINHIFHYWGCGEFEHVDYKRDCSHLFSFHLLSLACFLIMDLCMIFLHFLSLTSRRHYWEFEIQDKEVPRCPELEMEGTNTSCIFYFSICEKVPSYCPAGSGICLAKKVSPLKYPNITLYTRFIDIGTASEVFDSGRTLVLFSQHSQ